RPDDDPRFLQLVGQERRCGADQLSPRDDGDAILRVIATLDVLAAEDRMAAPLAGTVIRPRTLIGLRLLRSLEVDTEQQEPEDGDGRVKLGLRGDVDLRE